MTIEEVSERYQVPINILKMYENWGLCGAVKTVIGERQYDHEDIERLSMIMTLQDVGLTSVETETYMRLFIAGRDTEAERMQMLEKIRTQTVDELHFKQKQLDQLDYLRYKIQDRK